MIHVACPRLLLAVFFALSLRLCGAAESTVAAPASTSRTAKSGTSFVFGNNQLTDEAIHQQQKLLMGIAHEHRLQPADPKPFDPVTLTVTVGPGLSAHDVWCYYTTDGTNPSGAKGVAKVGRAVEFNRVDVSWNDLVWGFLTKLQATIPGQPDGTLVRYIIECDGQYANGGEGRHNDTAHSPYFAYSVDTWKTPAWIRTAVMYYVMPDRFYPGDNRKWTQTDDNGKPMGGTLRGIQEKLGYIQDMGFNCLWLMPWVTAPSYHKYDAIDFWKVDPGLGTEEDLQNLLRAAHARSMRVIVDFVANHCSNQNPIFQQARSNPASPYRKWFQFFDDGTYKAFFGGPEVPHLVNENPETRKYIIDLAVHWLRDYGIDGFDLDYAIGPSHEFWTTFARAVRRAKSDVVLFTEGVTTPGALRTYVGRVDGSQDFAWCHAARLTFGSGEATVEDFEHMVEGASAFFPDGFVAPVMIDNQNMDRFLVVAQGDQRRLRLAAACLYATSQPISMWAGTEMGMSQRKTIAEGNLNMVRDATAWNAVNGETQSYFRHLGELRASHPVLGLGARQPLLASAATGLLAYQKTLGPDRCVVVLNASGVERSLTLPEIHGCRDVLGGLAVTNSAATGTIALPAFSAAYLFPAE